MTAGDHSFHARTFTTSVVSLMFFSGLVFSTYLDMYTCPYERDGSTRVGARGGGDGSTAPIHSILDPNFRPFPCFLIDALIWTYIIFLVVFSILKYWMYRKLRFHYFFGDFCHICNWALVLLLLYVTVQFKPHFDIKPIGYAIASLAPTERKYVLFTFFGLFTGSVGPMLGAIWLWKNALVLHDHDKLTSCYIHIAPATVQVLMLQHAMLSVKDRETSKSREMMKEALSYKFLIFSHAVLFLFWQIAYHLFVETRTRQRESKAKKLTAEGKHEEAERLLDRVTARTWLLEHPPGGKDGIAYKFVTYWGTGDVTKITFSIVQAVIHFVFVTVAFAPIWLSAQMWDTWPLLLLVFAMMIHAVRNAAMLMKRFIQKLQKAAEGAGASAAGASASESNAESKKASESKKAK